VSAAPTWNRVRALKVSTTATRNRIGSLEMSAAPTWDWVRALKVPASATRNRICALPKYGLINGGSIDLPYNGE